MASAHENVQSEDVEQDEAPETQLDANGPQLSAPFLFRLRTNSKQRHTRQLNKMYLNMQNRESKTELRVHRGFMAELHRDCEIAHQNYKRCFDLVGHDAHVSFDLWIQDIDAKTQKLNLDITAHLASRTSISTNSVASSICEDDVNNRLEPWQDRIDPIQEEDEEEEGLAHRSIYFPDAELPSNLSLVSRGHLQPYPVAQQQQTNNSAGDPYRLSSLHSSPPLMPFGTWFRAFQQGRETVRAAAEQQESATVPSSSSGDTDAMLALSTHSLLAITSQSAPILFEESNAQAAQQVSDALSAAPSSAAAPQAASQLATAPVILTTSFYAAPRFTFALPAATSVAPRAANLAYVAASALKPLGLLRF